jgi:YfiR/HmsC-like
VGRNVLATARRALSGRSRRALLALLCLCSVAGLRGVEASADDNPVADPPSASGVAQVVLGIISYTRWPSDPPELKLCIAPPSIYADAIERAAAHATGRPIHVLRVASDDASIGDACNVIYLGAVSDAVRDHVLALLPGHSVLTISEHDDECAVGSVFCLALRDSQVSFKVNLDSLARSGVRVNPSVLQLGHGKAARP